MSTTEDIHQDPRCERGPDGLCLWDGEAMPSPMRHWTVHTKLGVTYPVEARTEGEAWSAGLKRINAARDRAVLPITGVTEDPS